MIQIGDTFNKLTVVEIDSNFIDQSNHKRNLIKVKCECGNIFNVRDQYILKGEGTCKICLNLSKRKFKIGDKFDKLTIIGITCKNNISLYICKCDCGNEKNTRCWSLRKNRTNNCGKCEHSKKWTGYGEISGNYLYKIKDGANRRNLEFNITLEQIWELFLKQDRKCALSGVNLLFQNNRKKITETTASLDRIDSLKGYIPDNIQWIHKDMNIMKWDFDQNYFIKMCKLVTKTAKETKKKEKLLNAK